MRSSRYRRFYRGEGLGPEYPSGRPGPFVANIHHRRGRPEEVRHVLLGAIVVALLVVLLMLLAVPFLPQFF